MVVTFDTTFGKIECDSEKGIAYFYADDFECTINALGQFNDMWGRRFDVLWPTYSKKEASLDVWMPREIGRVKTS